MAAPGTYQDTRETLWTHEDQRPKFSQCWKQEIGEQGFVTAGLCLRHLGLCVRERESELHQFDPSKDLPGDTSS